MCPLVFAVGAKLVFEIFGQEGVKGENSFVAWVLQLSTNIVPLLSVAKPPLLLLVIHLVLFVEFFLSKRFVFVEHTWADTFIAGKLLNEIELDVDADISAHRPGKPRQAAEHACMKTCY
jgi:hypothetical protein